MFLVLLLVTLSVSIITSIIVVAFFRKPTLSIFMRIIGEDVAVAWHKFLLFALIVVGISSGVQLYKLERYISTSSTTVTPLVLDSNRWIFEVFRTVLSTLGGLAWALLVFFIIALIAFAIVKRRLPKAGANTPENN